MKLCLTWHRSSKCITSLWCLFSLGSFFFAMKLSSTLTWEPQISHHFSFLFCSSRSFFSLEKNNIQIVDNDIFHECTKYITLTVISSDIIFSLHLFSSESGFYVANICFKTQISYMSSWFYLQTQDVFVIITLSLRGCW